MPTFSNTSTKGLFSTPACCIGISAASTNTVPIKKIISRAMVVRMATGITLCGFSVSGGNADKLRPGEGEVHRHHGHQDRQAAVREPAFGGDIAQARRRGAILHRNDAEMAAPPRIINATMVITFTSENQNSPSAKKRVEMMLRPKITAQNTTHQIQTGTCGNQYCMQNPAAVKLDPAPR